MTGKEGERPICKHCRKAVDQAGYEAHTDGCLERRRQAARRKKERSDARKQETLTKASAMHESRASSVAQEPTGMSETSQGTKRPPKSSAGTTKKRKADDDVASVPPAPPEKEVPKKKKLKKDEPAKPKPMKPRGPVNVEIQCGVQIEPEKGGFCARSLTCKTHSMGLKRAVPGRSLPYDQLLALYQKKNQARQQKALMDAQVSAQVEEEAEDGVVDSDEEREAVMAGLARWRPAPIEQMVAVPIGCRYQHIRFKEMLGNALRTSDSNAARNIFSVPVLEAPSESPRRKDSTASCEDSIFA